MLQHLKKLSELLSPAERRRGCLLLVMITLMALLEVAGVASVLPFISVLASPEVVETNAYLNAAYTRLGFDDPERFLLLLGGLVFATMVTAIAFKALTIYALLRFTHMRGYTLGKRLVAGYLHQPYEWFLSRHSADLGKTILSEVEQVIKEAVVPLLQFIAHAAVAVALVVLLVIVDPVLALSVAAALGGAYALLYIALRGYLAWIGRDRVAANRERFEAVQEAFGGIKEVKIAGLENEMLKRFDGPAKRYARRKAMSQIATQVPRYGLEIIAFGGVLALILILLARHGGFQEALPLIGLYAFAGYRILPALQHVFANLARMRYADAALTKLHAEFAQLTPDAQGAMKRDKTEPMGLREAIELDGVSYTYPGADRPALRNVSLTIPVNTTIGIIGKTGSGKTTAVDIILGLLRPTQGSLKVDGTIIDAGNLRAWQRSIGYVPQFIYLADDTIAANIALGQPVEAIDHEAVERAARIANLHEFVTNELPRGYQTRTGERGVRLSGGQRQRIGIARALYHDPPVLIMDEATSALDNETEAAVMEAVNALGETKTIILIAHRLSTISNAKITIDFTGIKKVPT